MDFYPEGLVIRLAFVFRRESISDEILSDDASMRFFGSSGSSARFSWFEVSLPYCTFRSKAPRPTYWIVILVYHMCYVVVIC